MAAQTVSSQLAEVEGLGDHCWEGIGRATTRATTERLLETTCWLGGWLDWVDGCRFGIPARNGMESKSRYATTMLQLSDLDLGPWMYLDRGR